MRTSAIEQEKLRRIELIARVQIAQEAAKDATRRCSRNRSSRSFALVTEAKGRLAVLNRALAMMAVEAAKA